VNFEAVKNSMKFLELHFLGWFLKEKDLRYTLRVASETQKRDVERFASSIFLYLRRSLRG
jgi:hypothetical protein